MHPYQNQVDRMWEIIKLSIRAKKQGYWLEFLCLLYILLEIELRLLLTSKAGKNGIPIPPEKIDKQIYLMNLANLANDNGFIGEPHWQRIKDFNDVRKNAIHGLAQGKISYGDLGKNLEPLTQLVYDIQENWLPIKFGKEETFEEYLRKQRKEE